MVVCGYTQGEDEASNIAQRLVQQPTMGIGLYHAADDSVIPVAAADQLAAQVVYASKCAHIRKAVLYASKCAHIRKADQLATTYRTAAAGAEGAETRLKYVRYDSAPGPPITEFQDLLGHGSYELAFRDAGLYAWLLSHKCHRRLP